MRDQADELIPTRASLLLRLKDWRDDVSWQQFFNTYWELIYRSARQSGLSDAEAQDVVQETMFSTVKHMPEFKYDAVNGSFKAWLLNMTRWRILDQIRKRCKVVGDASVSSPDGDSPATLDEIIDPTGNKLDALWEADWQNTLYRAAMTAAKRRIDPLNYQLFDFYVNKDWPPSKVASTFNVTVAQVYLAKHRVTEMLKSEVVRLDRQGI